MTAGYGALLALTAVAVGIILVAGIAGIGWWGYREYRDRMADAEERGVQAGVDMAMNQLGDQFQQQQQAIYMSGVQDGAIAFQKFLIASRQRPASVTREDAQHMASEVESFLKEMRRDGKGTDTAP